MRNLLVLLCSIFLTVSSVHAASLSLASSSFDDWDKMNVLYTCDGKDISPQLSWKNAPKNTVSFVLIMSDPDASRGVFYHWVLFNIPKSVNNLAENITALPAGTVAGKNSFDKFQYNGPCPPKGPEHRYIFSLYALDSKLEFAEEADAEMVLDAIKNHVLGVAELTGKFGK